MELSQVNFVPRDGTKLEAADGSFKKTYTIPPKGTFDLPPVAKLLPRSLFSVSFKGPGTPDAIRQRDAIFRFSLIDNFDSSLNFPNI